MVKELPEWFKNKYNVELNSQNPEKMWVELKDTLKLFNQNVKNDN